MPQITLTSFPFKTLLIITLKLQPASAIARIYLVANQVWKALQCLFNLSTLRISPYRAVHLTNEKVDQQLS